MPSEPTQVVGDLVRGLASPSVKGLRAHYAYLVQLQRVRRRSGRFLGRLRVLLDAPFDLRFDERGRSPRETAHRLR